jgi:hypothetical protein
LGRSRTGRMKRVVAKWNLRNNWLSDMDSNHE